LLVFDLNATSDLAARQILKAGDELGCAEWASGSFGAAQAFGHDWRILSRHAR
jgi:hypothetical protein